MKKFLIIVMGLGMGFGLFAADVDPIAEAANAELAGVVEVREARLVLGQELKDAIESVSNEIAAFKEAFEPTVADYTPPTKTLVDRVEELLDKINTIVATRDYPFLNMQKNLLQKERDELVTALKPYENKTWAEAWGSYPVEHYVNRMERIVNHLKVHFSL